MDLESGPLRVYDTRDTKEGIVKISTCVLVAALASASLPAAARSLPFISDDFVKARTEAVNRKLPIFVEVWAPW